MKTHIPSAPASRCCSRLSKWCASASCAASGPWPCSIASACVDTLRTPKEEVWSLESGVWSQRQERVLTSDSRLQTPDLLSFLRLHPPVSGVLAAGGLVGGAGADDLQL